MEDTLWSEIEELYGDQLVADLLESAAAVPVGEPSTI
jgi:hypothetical protein